VGMRARKYVDDILPMMAWPPLDAPLPLLAAVAEVRL